ncbi:MAG: hypothetical protein ABL983_17795 [Nitrospira sp.]
MINLGNPQARNLLVGGSNCIIKDGYGSCLQGMIPGVWHNESLGNSSSLRGVEYIINHPSIDEVDYIFFEYTLNDLIFEISNTLDPVAHFNWLESLVSIVSIRKKLVFILLHGLGAYPRLQSGHSFVLNNYRGIIDRFNIRHIDLFPLIHESITMTGQAEVFKDNDHFSPKMVHALVAQSEIQLSVFSEHSLPSIAELTDRNTKVSIVDPLLNGQIQGAFTYEYSTNLVSATLVRLSTSSKIRFESPGGYLVGFYAIASQDSGCVLITHKHRNIVKVMSHRFNHSKPYLTLRHLTTPLYTEEGEEIIIRCVNHIYSVPHAILDHTLAEVIHRDAICGFEVNVGKFIFLISSNH